MSFGGLVCVALICVQAYVKMYQGDELPEPKSMLQASQISCVVLILFSYLVQLRLTILC